MRCLNLKLTYECSNNCSFCFSSYLKDEIIDLEYLKNMMKKGYQDGCRHIVFSGGEPTVKSDKLIELIRYAIELHYKECTIQTNGYGLSDESSRLFQHIKLFSENIDIKISFSVHGHNAKIHDEMTQTTGSFINIMNAIKNISNTSCEIYTNTVISARNIHYLYNIAECIQPYNPTIMQFSVMHIEGKNELAPGLLASAKAIHTCFSEKNATEHPPISKKILRTEGLPYCLLHSFEECVGESYWPTTLDLCNRNNEYMIDFNQLECGMRWRPKECINCIFNDLCQGIWKEHKDEFISLNIKPIC